MMDGKHSVIGVTLQAKAHLVLVKKAVILTV